MQRFIFLSVFILIYWLLNTLFLWHFYKFFQIKINHKFFLYSIIITAIFPLSMSLHRLLPNIFTRVFYYIWSTWLGIIFIWLVFSIIIDLIFFFWKNPTILKWYIWLTIISSISIYAIINQLFLNIVNVEIIIKNLEKEQKIWYISDVHIDGIHNISYLEKIINKINEQKVDFVIINWDLVDWTSFGEEWFEVINNFKSPVFFTFGNHETYIGKDFVKKLLKNTKAKILENEVYEINWIQIIWIEDMMWFNHSYNENKLNEILNKLTWNKNKPTILSLHEPLWMGISSQKWINLQLAWHTHNGQIWPFNYLVETSFPYIKWIYSFWKMKLYVWQWTWVWWPPLRLWSENEITIFNLKK